MKLEHKGFAMSLDRALVNKLMSRIVVDGEKIIEVRSDETSDILACEKLGMTHHEAEAHDECLEYIEANGYVRFTRSSAGVWIVAEIMPSGHHFFD